MKHPPTKFEVMRRNRIIAAARARIADARDFRYDEAGDPELAAAIEDANRQERDAAAMRAGMERQRLFTLHFNEHMQQRPRRPRRWWWPLGGARS